jgi:hypothetical protein
VNISERESKLNSMVQELLKLENVNRSLLNLALQRVKREGERIRGVMA